MNIRALHQTTYKIPRHSQDFRFLKNTALAKPRHFGIMAGISKNLRI
jgi:hypothetical protein